MCNVWAYRVGQWASKGPGWDRAFQFNTLADLVNELKRAKLATGQVNKLGIVAHGDVGGVVQLHEGDLTQATAAKFSKQLRELRNYLGINARVIFFSCIAGKGEQGSALLNELSGTYLPGRHVIGFEQFGYLSGMPQVQAMKQAPGELRCSTVSKLFVSPCAPTPNVVKTPDPLRSPEQILNEHSIYAKWSYEGKIIKLPYSEVEQEDKTPCKVIYGLNVVKQALMREHSQIKYIVISKSRTNADEIDRFYNFVQQPPYKFDPGIGVGTLQVLDPKEFEGRLDTLAGKKRVKPTGSQRISGIAAVYKKLNTGVKYKCASKQCPGHRNFRDFCESFVKDIPNGPLAKSKTEPGQLQLH